MENKKTISQKEYLKKYLSSGDDKEKKKKKKKLKVGSKTVKIIDDDIDLKNMRPIEDGEFDILLNTEDAPLIVGVVDERGPVDFTDKRRWKIIADDTEEGLTIASSGNKKENKFNQNSNSDTNKSRNYTSDFNLLKQQKNKKRPETPERNSKNYDSDQSPPRSKRNSRRSETPNSDSSQPRQRRDEDSDLSPPRKGPRTKNSNDRNKKYESDLSPLSNRKNDSDSSSPRKKKSKSRDKNRKSSDSDLSPPRNSKNNNSDLSPVRKSKNYDSDLSPPRRNKNDDSDLSPPRKKKNSERSNIPDRRDKYHYSKYTSDRPKLNPSRKNDDSDLSPPRHNKNSRRSRSLERRRRYETSNYKHRRDDYDSDENPPRSRKGDQKLHNRPEKRKYSRKSLSPPQSKKCMEPNFSKNYSSSRRKDNSSPSPLRERRRRRSNEKDENHFNRKQDSSRRKSSRWSKDDRRKSESPDTTNERMTKTLDGKTAGLQDARALRDETEAHKTREAENFEKLSKEVTGFGQATIVRDKSGRKRNFGAEVAEEREKQKKQDELDEKYAKWGSGLKQVGDREERLKDDLYEMSKPLARYADDADLDKKLREQDREGDPMLEYIKQKQIKEGKRKPDEPKYEGSFMPNRFGIKPGHRWDGVDRSNGYEKKWFDAKNAKVAMQEEAYKWSTADM